MHGKLAWHHHAAYRESALGYCGHPSTRSPNCQNRLRNRNHVFSPILCERCAIVFPLRGNVIRSCFQLRLTSSRCFFFYLRAPYLTSPCRRLYLEPVIPVIPVIPSPHLHHEPRRVPPPLHASPQGTSRIRASSHRRRGRGGAWEDASKTNGQSPKTNAHLCSAALSSALHWAVRQAQQAHMAEHHTSALPLPKHSTPNEPHPKAHMDMRPAY